jgi:hypothetical protein
MLFYGYCQGELHVVRLFLLFLVSRLRRSGKGSLEKELSAKPTEDGLPQFPIRKMLRLLGSRGETERKILSQDTEIYIAVVP